MENPRNVIVSDVEFRFIKLASPVQNPFSKKMQYEMLLVAPESRSQELKDLHLDPKPVKKKDGSIEAGVVGVSVRRNVEKANGEDNGQVRVVDAAKAPIENLRQIGNGSKGNVILFQYPWENMGRKGISSSLTAVQVVELEIYNGESGGVDFDVIGAAEVETVGGESKDLF